MTSPPPAKKPKLSVSDLLAPAPPKAPQSAADAAPALLNADGSWAAAERIRAQMPDAGIPLTILTGFLGAGKSTILNYILSAPHSLKIAVLINEYGAIDIDSKLVDTSSAYKEGDPVVLDNGCICCTVSNGFIDAVRRILEAAENSGNSPDYIIVETTGVADPKPIIDSIQETELRDEVYVDQVLTAVDSSAWSDAHYNSPTAKNQIERADTVLLTKTDLVKDQSALDAVIGSVRTMRPNSRILRSQAGYVPIHALFDLDIKTAAVGGPKAAIQKKPYENADGKVAQNEEKKSHVHMEGHGHAHREGHGKHAEKHEGDGGCGHPGHEHHDGCATGKPKGHLEQEGFSSVSFTSTRPLSMSRFRADFMEELPDEVFRAKGLLWFNSYDSKFVFHWSGSRYNVDEGEWEEGAQRCNQLVVIGRNLNKERITAMLESCVVKPGEEDKLTDDEYEDVGVYEAGNDQGEIYKEIGEGVGEGVEEDKNIKSVSVERPGDIQNFENGVLIEKDGASVIVDENRVVGR